MLAETHDILQMCSSFDANKSTKGASKLRRDLINTEIANLRDLLPLPSSTRQRLSQLQLMALVCVYVRKANYFQQVFRKHDPVQSTTPNFGFSKALSGFLMMTTQNGKLLYISDNAAEYLGHSMEDLLIHGDSVFDIIDKQDHQAVQAELLRSSTGPGDEERMFLCRMNVSRNARRQMRFGDQKVVLVQGHFLSFLPLCSRNEPVFLATCTPVAMPETRECVVQGATHVFTSIHSMDMKFLHIDRNGEFYLGYTKNSLQGVSWYQLVHWENMREAQSKHRLITQSEQDRSCILLLRLYTQSGSTVWVHAVLQVKDNLDNSQQPVIVCTNQILTDKEAAVMRANSWLYHYYSVQSKLQYGLAYETHTTRMPAYYPSVVTYASHPEPPVPPTYLPPAGPSSLNGSQHSSPTMPPPQYAFPPPGTYHHLPVSTPDSHGHLQRRQATLLRTEANGAGGGGGYVVDMRSVAGVTQMMTAAPPVHLLSGAPKTVTKMAALCDIVDEEDAFAPSRSSSSSDVWTSTSPPWYDAPCQTVPDLTAFAYGSRIGRSCDERRLSDGEVPDLSPRSDGAVAAPLLHYLADRKKTRGDSETTASSSDSEFAVPESNAAEHRHRRPASESSSCGSGDEPLAMDWSSYQPPLPPPPPPPSHHHHPLAGVSYCPECCSGSESVSWFRNIHVTGGYVLDRATRLPESSPQSPDESRPRTWPIPPSTNSPSQVMGPPSSCINSNCLNGCFLTKHQAA